MKQQKQNNTLSLNITQICRHTHELKHKPTKTKKILIKVMQIYLPVRPQTGFHGDEMATSNWLDKRMLASEPKTRDGSENIQIPVRMHAYTQIHSASGVS